MRTRTTLLCFCLAILLGALGGKLFGPAVVGAVKVTNLKQLKNGDQTFFNYDFGDQHNTASNVDWPVTLLFTKHATIATVKKALAGFKFEGAKQYALFFVNGHPRGWQGNPGRKTDPCQLVKSGEVPYDYHLRLYGDYLSRKWGHWVIATSHIDHNDCDKYEDFDKTYGWSEDAEQFVAAYLKSRGYEVHVNDKSLNFGNIQSGYWSGNHYYQSDGYATRIVIP